MPISMEGGAVRVSLEGGIYQSSRVDLTHTDIPKSVKDGLMDGTILLPDNAVTIEPSLDAFSDSYLVNVDVPLDKLIYTEPEPTNPPGHPVKKKRNTKRVVTLQER